MALATPHEAIAHGINAVHQEVVLCPHLTVAANMFSATRTTRFGLLRKRAMVREAQEILDDLGFKLPAACRSRADDRPAAAGRDRARVHPRHSLPDFRRADRLSNAPGSGAALRPDPAAEGEGVTIVYISHRMEEVFELADRVSVLRDGALVGTRVDRGDQRAPS